MVGLYLDPPERALVFCVDWGSLPLAGAKSQIQALDRSQPVLPMMPGVPQRMTSDYVRAGITTLFAALDLASGKVIGSLHRRHRADLVQTQQPGQMQGIAGIGLDPIPGGFVQLGRSSDFAPDARFG